MIMIPTNNFLTVEQVAERLAVCRLTVYRLIKSQRLRAYSLVPGGTWRIEPADLDEFLKGCRSGDVVADSNV